jgi:hypothetical protein
MILPCSRIPRFLARKCFTLVSTPALIQSLKLWADLDIPPVVRLLLVMLTLAAHPALDNAHALMLLYAPNSSSQPWQFYSTTGMFYRLLVVYRVCQIFRM